MASAEALSGRKVSLMGQVQRACASFPEFTWWLNPATEENPILLSLGVSIQFPLGITFERLLWVGVSLLENWGLARGICGSEGS